MKKRYIKRYNEIVRVKIGNCFVRKNHIETVNEEITGRIVFRTTSGCEFTLTTKEAIPILEILGFNEK